MARPLRLTIVGLSGVTLGVLASRCATPTQLIVEVTTDAPCERIHTGIFVGKTSADTNDLAGPVVSKDGCESPGIIGSAVFLPRGDQEEAFAIKVITGVDATVTECITGVKQTCIVEHRAVRYESGAITRVDVAMDQQCIGVECGPKETCKRGTCIACESCTDPTGVDASPSETSVDANDGAPAPCDPPCTSCSGDNNHICTITCTAQQPCAKSPIQCPPGKACVIECGGKDVCQETIIDCAQASTCSVHCASADACHTAKINCADGPCNVFCDGPGKDNSCHTASITTKPSTSFCLQCATKEACDLTCTKPTPMQCSKICGGEKCGDGICSKECSDNPNTVCPPP